MKSKNAPQLSTSSKTMGCGPCTQGNVMFNHRSYAGVKEYGPLSRLSGGFGPYQEGGKLNPPADKYQDGK